MSETHIIDDKEILKEKVDSLFDFILFPIYKDNRVHPCRQEISALYILDTHCWYRFIIPINHSEKAGDITIFDIENIMRDKNIYVWDKKSFIHHTNKLNGLYDLQLITYYKGFTYSEPHLFQQYYHKWERFSNINTIIPLPRLFDEVNKWVEQNDICETFYQYRESTLEKSYPQYEKVIETFADIEKSGIYHKDNGLQYTQYNLFTTTGRPSNRFGGINYAALNKSDDTRTHYTSRYEGGKLFLYDYEAFHPTMISNYLKIERPEGISPHYWLGQQYFGKDELTDEELEESKKLTFYYLYGDMTEVKDIEFFSKVNEFIDTFEGKDHMITPILKRTIPTEGMNKTKMFNYFLQNLESEINFMKLRELNQYLREYKSKMVLYTYDSFLIDYSPHDPKSVLTDIKSILEKNQLKVSVKYGNDYKNMKDIS